MAFTTLGYVVMQAQQRVGQPCWRYWFDYVPRAADETCPHGAWHGDEVPYVFDTLTLAEPVRTYADEEDRAFAAQVADYWANFARLAGHRCSELPGRYAGPPACAGAIVCCASGCISGSGLSWKTALCAPGWRCFAGSCATTLRWINQLLPKPRQTVGFALRTADHQPVAGAGFYAEGERAHQAAGADIFSHQGGVSHGDAQPLHGRGDRQIHGVEVLVFTHQ
jgi:hypothetical protein